MMETASVSIMFCLKKLKVLDSVIPMLITRIVRCTLKLYFTYSTAKCALLMKSGKRLSLAEVRCEST
jgi:hypothetical protein